MLIAIIKNNNGTYEHLYKMKDTVIPYHIDKNGVSISDETYINSLLSKFKYNKSHTYITRFKEYDVYYDFEMNLKHFLLNGKEDYEMLFKYNGSDACLYLEKGKPTKMVTKIVSLGICLAITFTGIQFLSKTDFNIKIDPSIYSAHSYSDVKDMHEYEAIDPLEAIDCINNSNIPDNVKEVVANEDFLRLIFSYYKGSALEYTARLKFENLKLEPFEENAYENNETVHGYYNPLDPNVIHSRSNDETYIQIIVHEFIHLLQAESFNYMYLTEASAELMASELLDSSPQTYLPAVQNLKLLINIIGPESIYELIFGGDDTRFNSILKDNLSLQDYIKLTQYLKKDGFAINTEMDFQIEIQNILYKLYENIYGKDIKADRNIMCATTALDSDFEVSDRRYFLLPYKMDDEEFLQVRTDNEEKLAEKGLVEKRTCYKELIKIENPTYESILGTNIELKENLNNEDYIYGKVFFDGEKGYYKHLEKPIKREDYNLSSFIYLPAESYDIQEAIEKGYITAYKVIYSDEKTRESQIEHTYYVAKDSKTVKNGSYWRFYTDGIKLRFNDQYNNLKNRMTEEAYQK